MISSAAVNSHPIHLPPWGVKVFVIVVLGAGALALAAFWRSRRR